MQLTSTMKPFETGDIFLGCTYLNKPDDDHMGDGRILQFDRHWRPKGTLYTEGTRYLMVGCRIGPDGTLWAFDCYDLRERWQLEDLDAYSDADPFDRSDRRWFIAPRYLDDGRLLCTVAEGLRIYDESGSPLKDIPLPGYGWAQVTPDVDPRFALAANIWTGIAARIDLDSGAITESIDVGFTAPHRSLAGIAVYKGQAAGM